MAHHQPASTAGLPSPPQQLNTGLAASSVLDRFDRIDLVIEPTLELLAPRQETDGHEPPVTRLKAASAPVTRESKILSCCLRDSPGHTIAMSNTDVARMGKRIVQYFWDPLPRNEDSSDLWCLGRSYDSRFSSRSQQTTSTSPSSKSDSAVSQADSGVVTIPHPSEAENDSQTLSVISSDQPSESVSIISSNPQSQSQISTAEEEALGWPSEFLDDLEARIWLTYRSGFAPISRSSDPAASAAMSFSTKLRNLTSQGGFTSDTGWGCMIRSGQSLLANTLAELRLGRDWRLGQKQDEHKELVSLFADAPEAPFSLHRFVEHGAQACGKHPGEWFGPSATARCIQALTEKYHESKLRVYVRPDDSDVYADQVIATATAMSASDDFEPTLILLGIRLGIDRVTPVYHATLKAALELPQSVGIAGGRPSSSHYFVGHQSNDFFYLDPHSTRASISPQPTAEEVQSCHTRRVRRLNIAEMDPSMLLGFLVKTRQDFDNWRAAVQATPGKAIIHLHDSTPKYATSSERAGAVDEVETWETGDDDDDDD